MRTLCGYFSVLTTVTHSFFQFLAQPGRMYDTSDSHTKLPLCLKYPKLNYECIPYCLLWRQENSWICLSYVRNTIFETYICTLNHRSNITTACSATLPILKLIARLEKYYYREGKWLYKKYLKINISFVMPSARRESFNGKYTDWRNKLCTEII